MLPDSSQLHQLQHTRLLCPQLFPGVCANSCPLSWWCYLAISSPAALLSFAFNLSQHQCFSNESTLGGTRGKEHACQGRTRKRDGLDPWLVKIPWRRKWKPTPVLLPGKSRTEEPDRLQSMGSQRVGHDWATSLHIIKTKIKGVIGDLKLKKKLI